MVGDLDSLADFFAVFVEAEGKAETTQRTYDKSVRALIKWVKDERGYQFVSEITQADMAAYMVELSTRITRYGKAPEKSSTATTFRHLQQWFKWLVNNRTLTVSPLMGLKAQQATRKPVPLINADHLKALLAGCDNTWEGRRDEAIMRILIDAGPRISELVGMDIADVSTAHRTIRVQGKGTNGAIKLRDLPLGSKTLLALGQYLRMRDRHYKAGNPELWLSRNQNRYTSKGIAVMISRRCQEAGVPHINPHKFRHTFAHLFRKNGGQAHELMSVGGWDSESMVRRYGESAIAEEARETHRRIAPGDMF